MNKLKGMTMAVALAITIFAIVLAGGIAINEAQARTGIDNPVKNIFVELPPNLPFGVRCMGGDELRIQTWAPGEITLTCMEYLTSLGETSDQ